MTNICYYSKITKGFYSDGRSDIPSNAIAITIEQRDALLAGEKNGQVISAGSDGIPFLTDRVFTKAEQNAPILAQLDIIDSNKIRCISDISMGNGDVVSGGSTPNQRLASFEAQAATLRAQLVH